MNEFNEKCVKGTVFKYETGDETENITVCKREYNDGTYIAYQMWDDKELAYISAVEVPEHLRRRGLGSENTNKLVEEFCDKGIKNLDIRPAGVYVEAARKIAESAYSTFDKCKKSKKSKK